MRKGQLNAKERKIILMREERKAQQQQHSSSNAFSTEGAGAAAAAAKPVLDEEEVQLLKRLRAEGTRESRLAECALRGLSGVGIDEEQQLRTTRAHTCGRGRRCSCRGGKAHLSREGGTGKTQGRPVRQLTAELILCPLSGRPHVECPRAEVRYRSAHSHV